MPRKVRLIPMLALVALLAGCHATSPLIQAQAKSIPLVEGARDQLSWATGYDPAYLQISYPGGDVPRSKGVCTDVVVRAYRHVGVDLQKLIHQDITKRWSSYPRYRGSIRPDSNIDHRRVPNQRVFFEKYAKRLPISTDSPKNWHPGDIVQWKIQNRLDHTGIVSDKLDSEGFPLVIHNLGNGPEESDDLRCEDWVVTGHYRYP